LSQVTSLEESLARYRQIKISVIGWKSGRRISVPVWFVLEGDKLYLLPVQRSDICQMLADAAVLPTPYGYSV